ncbi:uncharacterized protein TrAtP1_007650 [Trichoderma atroviride]|uniref:uncharacterized protein n=1 Tax=Hypocrea atroviridis TaxID=63577 RepID=UPI0033258078|nr:hypothetical protein TrAtP1_007650 [Trichoderma atroviride]
MTAWMKYPANTAIANFEFITFPGSLRFPCQVAIADGFGEWIIAPTTINHGITKGERRSLRGKSCQEIADLIDQYVKKHGALKTFMAWGSQDCDLNYLRYILRSAKAEHLLPPALRFAAQPLT